MKNKIGPIVRTTVSALLIIILLYVMRDKYADIARAVKNTNMAIFSMAFAAFVAAALSATIRMKLIIEAQGISLTLREALSLTFIGYFFNNFLPTAIGGDIIKAHYLSKHSGDKTRSYTAIFVDRAIGLITMIFMAFIALAIAGSGIIDRKLATIIYIITAISILGILFLSNKNFAKKFTVIFVLVKPIESQLKTLYSALHAYHNRVSLMAGTISISVISQLFFFSCYGILALSIGSKIRPIDLLLKMPLVSTISLLPSINGLGVREGAVMMLFGPTIGRENALAISILILLILIIVSIIGGIIYTMSPQFKMNLKNIEKEKMQ